MKHQSTHRRASNGGTSRCRARRWTLIVTLTTAVAPCVACTRGETDGTTRAAYKPQTRNITITTVPLLVKEQQAVLPFLKEDFAKGGVLDGKEVYAFSPSTVTVVEGDTIHFALINPEDDAHSFVLPDLAVPLPGQATRAATYVAARPGVFPFVCAIQAHLPMMSGQLVVLPAASMAGMVHRARD